MKENQFKLMREGLGLSQEELSQVLGLSGKQAVCNIETGFRNPSRLLMALMQVLDVLPEKRSKEIQDLLLSFLIQTQKPTKKKTP